MLSRILRSARAGAAHTHSHTQAFERNVPLSEILPTPVYLKQTNYLKRPLWQTFWEGQFNSRTFLFWGKSWMTIASLTVFLWWTRLFDPPPTERLDRYWLNSPKFRILSAFHNKDKRPGFAISLLTFDIRYYFRGLDHPFGVNETKDMLFKLKENFLIAKHANIQYPYVFKQINKVQTPATLKVNVYPTIQKSQHHHDGDH